MRKIPNNDFTTRHDIRIVDSRILFEDPDKLVGRFLSLISNLFGIDSLTENHRLIFALGGIIDAKKRKIILSNSLNNIASTKLFDGFNFVEAFDKVIGGKNVFLLNDSHTVAAGVVASSDKDVELPALSLYINEHVGVSIIKDSGIINYDSSIVPIEHLGNETAHELLCDVGIDDNLFNNSSGVFEQYTDNLSEVIKSIIVRGAEDGFSFKNIFIHSHKCEFILVDNLRKNLKGFDVSITDGNDAERDLPVVGIFNSLNFLSKNDEPRDLVSNNNLKIVSTMTFAASFGSSFAERFGGMGLAGKIALVAAAVAVPILPIGGIIGGLAGLAVAAPHAKKMVKEINNNKRTSIIYYSSKGDKIKTFKEFEKFVEHWKEINPIAYGKNYYDLLYSDKTKIKIEIDNLNSITDLQKYEF